MMKYIKRFNESLNKSQIDAICEKYNIKNYIINEDGSIDINGDVYIYDKKLEVLPLKFRNVSGNFDCGNNQLKNLIGVPQYVGGDFYCSSNQLTNLIGSPQYVGGNFYSSNNQLTSLEGAPKKVYGNFWSRNNKLKNIDYLPKKYKGLNIKKNPIHKILDLFTKHGEYGWISNTTYKELIMDFIDREIIQQDILLVNRLVEFLYDIDKPKSREELIEILKNDYTIR